MTQSDQFELLYKTFFMFAIQVFFCYCLINFGGVKFENYSSMPLQLSLIFTTLLLHLNFIGSTRSGLYMMKYALCQPEVFTHPSLAFTLGFMQMTTTWVSEFINIMKGSQRKNTADLISGYIGLKVIMELPAIYLKADPTLPIISCIGKVTIITPRKSENRSKSQSMPVAHWLFNLTYLLHKWFFKTIYFYFFTFTVIALPFTSVLISKELAEAK